MMFAKERGDGKTKMTEEAVVIRKIGKQIESEC